MSIVLGVFFGRRSSLLFWQKGNFMCVKKSNTIFTKFPFSAIEELSYIREKKCHLVWWYKKNHIPVQFFWERPSFQNIWRKYYISMYFLRNSSFIFHLKSKIIFSGKRNIMFPDDTRKIIFQCDFFGKTIFSDHLKNENMVFRAVIHKDKQLSTTMQ